MSAGKAILLLGRRDEPTDGVLDYCEMLRAAAARRGLFFELARVGWAEKGWGAALAELRKQAESWRDQWVLLQFTTLAWSRRGFPLRAPHVLRLLRQSGVRTGVVFHDFFPVRGKGIVGKAREISQARALHQLYALSDLSIFTVPVNKVGWLPVRRDKATFIPVGANCPEGALVSAPPNEASRPRTVAIYSITGGADRSVEVADLACALRRAAQSAGPIHAILFGRGSKEGEPSLRSELAGADVQLECVGLLPPDQVSETLSRADVLLFVRGQISSRRGSAIAGIVCGLPVVCYSGPETAWPVMEAGILAVPLRDREALAAGLETVLRDEAFRKSLAERSRRATEKYFSWAAIAEQFVSSLGTASASENAVSSGPASDATRVT
jgi:glycosyltransferase involved in cell wall biosynthesis